MKQEEYERFLRVLGRLEVILFEVIFLIFCLATGIVRIEIFWFE